MVVPEYLNCFFLSQDLLPIFMLRLVSRDSTAGIVTRYRVDGPGIESRWGPDFSPPVQTGRGVHPASCTMGTGSLYRG